MAHKGVREFTGEELSGIALGQNGFRIISGAEVECGVGDYADIEYFVALKATDVDSNVEARSYISSSDDLTTASGGTYDSSSPVTLINGDIVYGAFDKVDVASSSHYIIAYIGI